MIYTQAHTLYIWEREREIDMHTHTTYRPTYFVTELTQITCSLLQKDLCYTHTHTHTHTHIYMHIHTHTYIYTHTQTHHTYIYIYIYLIWYDICECHFTQEGHLLNTAKRARWHACDYPGQIHLSKPCCICDKQMNCLWYWHKLLCPLLYVFSDRL